MNNLLFFMCLMGSMMYISYILLCKLFQSKYSPGMRMFTLAVSGVFYTVPVPILWRHYTPARKDLLYPFTADYIITFSHKTVHIPQNKIITLTKNGVFHLPRYSRFFLTFIAVWGIILFYTLIKSILHFYRYRQFWFQISQALPPDEKNMLDLKKKIRVRTFSVDHSPFVMGFFHPVIFIPEHQMQGLDIMIKHEAEHIHYLHNFIKTWGFIIFALHWYCPLSFLFYLSLSNTLELLCDQKILKHATNTEKKEYAYLLLNVTNTTKSSLPYCAHFSPVQYLNYYFTKERLKMIKKTSTGFCFPAFIFILASIFISVTPVMAYQMPYINICSDSEPDDSDTTEFVFVPDGQVYEPFEPAPEKTYFDISDEYFVTDSGKIIFDFPTSNLYVSCKHTYQNGVYYLHKKKAGHSCTMEKRSKKCCTKCGHCIRNSLISSTQYPKCPH